MGQLCPGSFLPRSQHCTPCRLSALSVMPLPPTCDVGAECAANRCLVPMGAATLVRVYPLRPSLLGGLVPPGRLGQDVCFSDSSAQTAAGFHHGSVTYWQIHGAQSCNKACVSGSFQHLLVGLFSAPGAVGVVLATASSQSLQDPGSPDCCPVGWGEGKGRIPLCKLRPGAQARWEPGGR